MNNDYQRGNAPTLTPALSLKGEGENRPDSLARVR